MFTILNQIKHHLQNHRNSPMAIFNGLDPVIYRDHINLLNGIAQIRHVTILTLGDVPTLTFIYACVPNKT